MISREAMLEAEGKHINIKFTDGDIWENKYCYCFYQGEDEGEEDGLEIGKHWLISQSEIKSIEILD